LKVDAGSRYLTGHPRFADGRKRLVITGERAQESAARSKYSAFEADRCDLRNGQRYQRWLDHWRPVLLWTEADVWAILERYRINAHPAYHLGFGRASCMSCIFGSASQWATVRALSPEHFERIADYEEDFGVTIHRSRSVREQADRGTPFPFEERWKRIALSTTYDEPIFVDPWVLPLGAHGDSSGPT
jgi:3'-phosphoadenosine 5'-phosphosulfate sulfotransferase (PAPS reductase)/FAD synthetase